MNDKENTCECLHHHDLHTKDHGDAESVEMAGYACRVPGCTCPSFKVAGRYDAQFCENCGHARSQHVPR